MFKSYKGLFFLSFQVFIVIEAFTSIFNFSIFRYFVLLWVFLIFSNLLTSLLVFVANKFVINSKRKDRIKSYISLIDTITYVPISHFTQSLFSIYIWIICIVLYTISITMQVSTYINFTNYNHITFDIIFSLITKIINLAFIIVIFIQTEKINKFREQQLFISNIKYQKIVTEQNDFIEYLRTFIAYSNHSLKNSATIIQGTTDLMYVNQILTENDLDDLQVGCKHLWLAIDDFGTLGKRKGEINFPIFELLNAIVLLHKSQTKKLYFNINYQNIDNTQKLNVEWYDAYQMLDNLLINAYDAVSTTEKKEILILISLKGNHSISFQICDTGVGIEQKNISKLFVDSFSTKSDNNRERGKGLNHVNYLAKKYQGEVYYRGGNEEFSTIFELKLPMTI